MVQTTYKYLETTFVLALLGCLASTSPQQKYLLLSGSKRGSPDPLMTASRFNLVLGRINRHALIQSPTLRQDCAERERERERHGGGMAKLSPPRRPRLTKRKGKRLRAGAAGVGRSVNIAIPKTPKFCAVSAAAAAATKKTEKEKLVQEDAKPVSQ